MGLELGAIVEARVTGITKFGAFVSLPDGKSGLVHISEIANSYVSDVSEHVSIGQIVKVCVLSISDDGKINLSIKRAQQKNQSPVAPGARTQRPSTTEKPLQPQPVKIAANEDFEERLKKFMRESDSRIADNRMYSEHRQRSHRR